jgi:hypothetical protein
MHPSPLQTAFPAKGDKRLRYARSVQGYPFWFSGFSTEKGRETEQKTDQMKLALFVARKKQRA